MNIAMSHEAVINLGDLADFIFHSVRISRVPPDSRMPDRRIVIRNDKNDRYQATYLTCSEPEPFCIVRVSENVFAISLSTSIRIRYSNLPCLGTNA